MRVLVTGAAGYIGSVLCPMLLREGHSVVAVDNFRYGPQQATALAACCADPNFDIHRVDARDQDAMRPLLRQAEAVIPLAALVGAPLCDRYPDEAVRVNRDAVEWLTRGASPEQLIILPNTNSCYGSMSPGANAPLDETAPQRPLSVYADTKHGAEKAVLDHQSGVVFRLATVFGASPRMRTDLLVNDFVLRAVRDGSVVLYEPQFRRNFIHVRDVCRAFCWALEKYWGSAGGLLEVREAFNLGLDSANLDKAQLCQAIAEQIPGFFWTEASLREDPDKRDYLVSSAKLLGAGFEPKHTLQQGIAELIKLYRGFAMTAWGNV